ncbi:hypothetical protein Tco_0769272 [Tanacetum coccineum]|uniref:Reverse transcriptase domain-containing protein n=1 Tax=Tanacetum coccineum TaxID=301880 RepID=A0ABQ4ZAP5_9ASTR
MSTSESPVLTHAIIEKLVAHSIATVLEAQVAIMASTNNPNSKPRKTHVARKCTYKKFTSYQLFYFNGTDGAVGLIRWFKRTESIFSRYKCAEKNKVRFAVSTLTKEALFWWNSFTQIIMVSEIPLDYVDDVPVVEPNHHEDVPIVLEPVLVDEDEDPKKDEFEEEEDPQEEEDDMEVDIEEDKNEPELTYPYEEVGPLNPPPPTFESEPDDEIKVENPIKHEDETNPVSVYEVGESSTATIPREDGDRFLHGFMRRDIDSLFGRMILDLGNEVHSSVKQGTTAMEKLVEKLGNVEEKAECKKPKKELEEARLSNTFLRMKNERVERDLYWTSVQAHEFYQEMIRRGFVFKERPNEAINVLIEDEKSPSSEPQGSPRDS